MPDIEHLRPAGVLDTPPILQYSQAVRVGDLVFVAGQGAFDAKFNVPADYEEECRTVFENLKTVLAAAGCTLADIVDGLSLHAQGGDLMTFWRIRNEYLSEPWPAWTVVEDIRLAAPNMRVEVKVTAVRRSS